MMKQKALALAVTGALASLASSGASALEFTAGNWKMDISGSVNAFYTDTSCDKTGGSAPFIVATVGPCNPGAGIAQNPQDSVAIQNGLLPGFINFTASTQARGLDFKGVVGFWPGTSLNNGAQTVGDVRKVYLEFGAPSWGNIKLGRDIGLFQQQAILNDMTLLTVGTGAGFQGAINTTLGMIGTGYIYTEFQPQITYTTPNWNGFSAALGVFQPRNTAGVGGFADITDTPGWQGMAQFEWKGQTTGKLWGSFAHQEAKAVAIVVAGGVASQTEQKLKGDGYEFGGKIGFKGFEAMLVGFWGDGIGESIQFTNSHDLLGNKRDSDGYLGQLTYKFGDVKLGASYGQTKLDATSVDSGLFGAGLAVPNLMDENRAWVLQIGYDLMPGFTLFAEYINNKQTSHSGCDALGQFNPVLGVGGGPFSCENEANTFAVGGIMFF